jgi:hypothetical protein
MSYAGYHISYDEGKNSIMNLYPETRVEALREIKHLLDNHEVVWLEASLEGPKVAEEKKP